VELDARHYQDLRELLATMVGRLEQQHGLSALED
jgi:hypothetical protein